MTKSKVFPANVYGEQEIKSANALSRQQAFSEWVREKLAEDGLKGVEEWLKDRFASKMRSDSE